MWFGKDKGSKNRFDHVKVGRNINLVQGSGSIVTETQKHTIDYEKMAKELQDLRRYSEISDADYRAFSEIAEVVLQRNEPSIREKIKQFAASFSTQFFTKFASEALMQFIQARMGG